MSDTTFADVNDVYVHRVCIPLGIGLCGQYQEDAVWFTLTCSVCEMIHELTPPRICPFRDEEGAPCDCFDEHR